MLWNQDLRKVVTCVYVNPKFDQFWIIDYRIYDPDGDGKRKLDHMKDMLLNCVYQKELLFWAVLMDSWYASKDMTFYIKRLGKIFYCPLKDNRQVDESGINDFVSGHQNLRSFPALYPRTPFSLHLRL